jgi:hypothetical protein
MQHPESLAPAASLLSDRHASVATATPLERAALASERCDLHALNHALESLAPVSRELETIRLVPFWLRLATDPSARAIDEKNFVDAEPSAPVDPSRRSAFVEGLLEQSQAVAPHSDAVRQALATVWLRSLSAALAGDNERFLSLCSTPLALDLLMSAHWRQCAWRLGAAGDVSTVVEARSRLAPIQSLEGEELVQMAFIGACAANRSQSARELLDLGAELDVALAGRSGQGARPGNALEQAIAHGSFEMARELLDLGAKTLSPASATESLLSQLGRGADEALGLLRRAGARFDEETLFKASLQLTEDKAFEQALFVVPLVEELAKPGASADQFWRAFARSADVACVQEGRWGRAVAVLLASPLAAPSANGLQAIHEDFARFGRDPAQLGARARAIEDIARQCDQSRPAQGLSLMEAADQRDLLRRSWRSREERAAQPAPAQAPRKPFRR